MLPYALIQTVATYAQPRELGLLRTLNAELGRCLRGLVESRCRERVIDRTMSPGVKDLFGEALLARAKVIRDRPGLIDHCTRTLTCTPRQLPAPVCLGVDRRGRAYIILRFTFQPRRDCSERTAAIALYQRRKAPTMPDGHPQQYDEFQSWRQASSWRGTFIREPGELMSNGVVLHRFLRKNLHALGAEKDTVTVGALINYSPASYVQTVRLV